jgi:hypothetical protein
LQGIPHYENVIEEESGGEAAAFLPHTLETPVIPNATKWSEESPAN